MSKKDYFISKSPFVFGEGKLSFGKNKKNISPKTYPNALKGFGQGIFLTIFIYNKVIFLSKNFIQGYSYYDDNSLFVISKNNFFLSFIIHTFAMICGYLKKFRARLTLYGLRIRIEKIFKKGLVLKLNLAHKVKWYSKFFRFKKLRKIKNSFIVFSKDHQIHNIFLYILRRFKAPDPYRGNGIKFYKEKLLFKKRKQFGVL